MSLALSRFLASYLAHPSKDIGFRSGCWWIGKRQFSVKELPWCAPKSSPNHKAGLPRATLNDNEKSRLDDASKFESQAPVPIGEFGIVAAMSDNRVIGLNGKIPWPRCTEDRQNFKNLTTDSILIIGRTTYDEEPNQKHISHTKECIVVSKTMSPKILEQSNVGAPATKLKIAGSLPDALGLAKEASEKISRLSDENQSIKCWVAGGERLYEEALRHKSAKELHLTTIHVDVDVEGARKAAHGKHVDFAMFPAKHRWDQRYREVSRVQGGGPTENSPDSPTFTYIKYERKPMGRK